MEKDDVHAAKSGRWMVEAREVCVDLMGTVK
jgi:hypothetical protein